MDNKDDLIEIFKKTGMMPITIRDKVLITGATGYLGNALIKRLYEAHDIVALARNEGKLIALKEKYPNIQIITGDVSDPCVIRKAVSGVNGVYHLAGFKSVTLAERQPMQCVKTNVYGSMALLEAIDQKNVDFIIGISTDKACKVSGTYGASKLMMEKFFYEQSFSNPQTKYRIVRYGNVIYSTGSVLEKWKDALLNGRKVILTEPTATRYFWTVEQAIDLIFDCLAKATDTQPYCPEMKSIRMDTLLKCMEIKYGKASAFQIIGLQEGENLHEQIVSNGVTSEKAEKYSYHEIMDMI